MRVRLARMAREALRVSNQLATFKRHQKVGVADVLYGLVSQFSAHSPFFQKRIREIDFEDVHHKMYELLDSPPYRETSGKLERSIDVQILIRRAFRRACLEHRNSVQLEDIMLQLLERGKNATVGHMLKMSGVTSPLERILTERCKSRPAPKKAPNCAHRRKHGGSSKKTAYNKRNNRKPACI